MTRHRLFNPEGLPDAVGFSYGAVAASGSTVYIAGLTGQRADGEIDESIVKQFAVSLAAVADVISASGGSPEDLVSMNIYTTSIDEYRNHLGALGVQYRKVFGKHYPPMALLGVKELFDKRAKVELVCVAVVPDD